MILTVGHSNHAIDEFLDMLRGHDVGQVVDVRTIPRSRHNPQFNREALEQALGEAGIAYRHMPELGGLRQPLTNSINTGWRNASFRGYADYMQTPPFDRNLDELIEIGSDHRTAIMCAEAVPWRCHRSLVADALEARGVPVEHIMSTTTRKPHGFTPFAKIENGRVTYPGLIAP